MVNYLLFGFFLGLTLFIISCYCWGRYNNNSWIWGILISVITFFLCGVFLLIGDQITTYKSIDRVDVEAVITTPRDVIVYVKGDDNRYVFDKYEDCNNISNYNVIFYEVRYYDLYKDYMKNELVYGKKVNSVGKEYETIDRR